MAIILCGYIEFLVDFEGLWLNLLGNWWEPQGPPVTAREPPCPHPGPTCPPTWAAWNWEIDLLCNKDSCFVLKQGEWNSYFLQKCGYSYWAEGGVWTNPRTTCWHVPSDKHFVALFWNTFLCKTTTTSWHMPQRLLPPNKMKVSLDKRSHFAGDPFLVPKQAVDSL